MTPDQQMQSDLIQSNLDEQFTKFMTDSPAIMLSKMMLVSIYKVPDDIVTKLFKLLYDTGTHAIAIELTRNFIKKNQIND